jgi:hypothetical protein
MPEKYPSPEDWATGRRLAAETRIIATTRRRSATNAARLDAWMLPRSDGLQAASLPAQWAELVAEQDCVSVGPG